MTAPAAAGPFPTHTPIKTPSLRRRFASVVYELLVMFGVGLVCGAIGAALLAIAGRPQDTLSEFIAFGVYGVYFSWFWSRHGQTLPMKTWHIKVVDTLGRPISRTRAVVRYLAATLWVAPAALLWHGEHRLWVIAAWGVLYGLSALLLPQRQFLHDLISGTRLIDVKPAVPQPSTR
jgi:uncharacterized RDD family membrane protein YckC